MTPRLDQWTHRVDRALQQLLRPRAGTPRLLHEGMRYAVLSNGKRFRPLLCLGACEAAGGTARQALSVACALELIHAYSLVHDDLPAMDNASERRGQPSCHRRFGEATAILVGDALLTRAFEVLSANGTPNALPILRTLSQASGAIGLIGGQALDLGCNANSSRFEVRSSKLTAKQLEEIARRKTGVLITASVVAGGLVAGATGLLLRRLTRFGERLGLAFQLRDDLHDRDGLVRVMGARAVHTRIQRLIGQANQALAPLGTRVEVLRALAEWVVRN